MPWLEILPDHRTCEVAADESILTASLRAGIPHTCVCGGNARCSTCRVLILEGVEHCAARTPEEQVLAERLAFAPGIRLACQTRVTGNAKLRRLVLDDEDVHLTSQIERRSASPSAVITGAAGRERCMVILFADIRDFTEFAEALPPYDVIHLLNRYFHEMSGAIERHGGSINSYVGDGLMALFDAQEDDDAPARAVAAGLEMLHLARTRLGPYVRMLYEKDLHIGIGAHLGEVVLGAVGVGTRRQITAIGDAVNLASRIEANNRSFGTQFLISQELHERVEWKFETRAYNPIALRGKTGRRTLYEVLRERA
ncbi:MAG: adenylate/guanylate cyclase domain-containing protein [Tepidisphaeraceae bacterium]